MIISASIRTDIPSLYAPWFMNRLRAGYVMVQNPRNPLRCSRVTLTPEVVDMIVFWSKNPGPMIEYLPEVDRLGFDYYFQVTITPYGKKIESGLPDKELIMDDFCRISDLIGPERIIWRYDPIILSDELTVDYHLRSFQKMASRLAGHTSRCVLSFVDLYSSVYRRTRDSIAYDLQEEYFHQIGSGFASTAAEYGIELSTCAEAVDLSPYGIRHGACIDRELIESLLGSTINAGPNVNRRPGCRCIEHLDIGSYDSCTNGCSYCYAVSDTRRAALNRRRHDPDSPLLIGQLTDAYTITEKQQKSLKTGQPWLL